MARGHAWQGGMHGKGEACVAGVCVWQMWQGGMHGRGACVAGGVCGQGHACMAGEMATATDGTHPTGMHSWF